MGDAFDPYYEWLGIPASEQPPHHYRLLGIGLFEESEAVIANAADRQMGHLRGFAAGKHSKLSQKLLNEVAAARVCLLNAEKKAAYDARLREQVSERKTPVPRAVPLAAAVAASTPVEADADEVPIHVAAEPHHLPHHDRSYAVPPLPLAAAGAAALLLLGALVWWLAGAGGGPPDGLEPPPIAALDPNSTDRSPGVPDAPAVPAEPEPGNGADSPEPTAPPLDDEPDSPEPVDADPPTPPEEEPPLVDLELPPPMDGPEEPIAPEEPSEPVLPPVREIVRRAVPDRSEQDQVRRVLDDTYDTAAAQSPEARTKLAEQLAALAEKAEDPTERFVLLRRASELASEGNDPARMLQLVARLADEFEVDRVVAQAHLLDAFSKRPLNEELIGALVGASSGVIDAALAAERFELADALSAAVYRASQPAAGRAFRVEALNRRREVQEQRDRWNEFQAALEKLKANPDDEASHWIAGRWYAFARGDWDQAMPHFAKSASAELRAAAQRELAAPPQDANAQVDLADDWWSLADAADSQTRPHWLTRAAYWYERARPAVTSPIVQAKVAKRLDEYQAVARPAAQPTETAPPPAVAPFDARQAASHQQAWSKHLKTPVLQTNSIQMRFVLVPPGEFAMGSAAEEVARLSAESRWERAAEWDAQRLLAETPKRTVRITRPFYLGAYPVTQAEYERVMGSGTTTRRIDPTRPAYYLSWYDAVEFCKRLTALPAEQAAGRGYRLPTEAEWEYACRAGTTTWFSFGDDPNVFGMHGWWRGNTRGRPQPVAQLKPNPWGLFDMHGNIGQWCSDRYATGYSAAATDDPRGPSTGTGRVVRGGSYNDNPRECRSASRHTSSPYTRTYQIGLRVVLVPVGELPAEEEAPPEPELRRPREGDFGPPPDRVREPGDRDRRMRRDD